MEKMETLGAIDTRTGGVRAVEVSLCKNHDFLTFSGGCDCGAYDWAKSPKKFARAHVSPKDFKTCAKTEKGKRIAKLERLLRYHRQNVFHANDFTADCHSRALGRLKASKTFKEMCRENEDITQMRHNERLARMGY